MSEASPLTGFSPRVICRCTPVMTAVRAAHRSIDDGGASALIGANPAATHAQAARARAPIVTAIPSKKLRIPTVFKERAGRHLQNRAEVRDMIVRARAKRIRDFGCGELLTIASGGSASLHYYQRDSSHPHGKVEHAYPSHSLVFTDVGEWQYHGKEPTATVSPQMLVAGTGLRHYVCSHPHNVPNECFIVAVADEAFEDEGDRLFPTSLLRMTPEMHAHRRALENMHDDPERLESLAFSLYDAVARASASTSAVPSTDVRMSYAKRLIRERCTRPTTIAAIAGELHLSRFTFTRRFLAHV